MTTEHASGMAVNAFNTPFKAQIRERITSLNQTTYRPNEGSNPTTTITASSKLLTINKYM